MRTRLIRIHETGGPEVMRLEEAEIGDPGPGQVRLKQTAIGVNFTDIYNRSGLYGNRLPITLGFEAAGMVEAVGERVEGFKVGDRVAYSGPPIGAYAEARLYPADRLVPLPSWIEDATAASLLLRGMTAEYLLRRAYPVKKGDTILVHAAAGGLGLIMCQWARFLGAHVIGAVGSADKLPIAQANGAEHVFLTGDPAWPAKVREVTDGLGVPVVYDTIGKETFTGSLDSLARRGLLVSCGNASGRPPPIELSALNDRGSLFVTRAALWDYIATRRELMESAASLFDVIHRGVVKPTIAGRFPLADAAAAHRVLESRKAIGSLILIP
ncbi:MAG TPA: quinone oxidoreductase [Alphaproteobacteria bacterium]|nr:quinone oxidoreductase [Alphaproteobacteria bacterium]